MKTKFKESYKIFQQWKNSKDSEIAGFCNWETEQNTFMLSCWTNTRGEIVIFQIWENGHGFHEYSIKNKVEKAAPELLNTLNEIIEINKAITNQDAVLLDRALQKCKELAEKAIKKTIK